MRLTRRLLSAATSVNSNEIAFFSKLSQQWWDESGEFGLLHRMNPVRVGYIRDKIEDAIADDARVPNEAERHLKSLGPRILTGLDVLDVGCGGGLLSESLARLGGRTLGIDASSSSVNIAKTHASQDPYLSSKASLEYRNTTTEELLGSQEFHGKFDIVCSMEVVEHVDNPAPFLKSCADLVKPGGHIFLSTISRTLFARFLTITMAEDILRLVSPGTHSYEKYVKPSELVSFFWDDLKWIQPQPHRGLSDHGVLPSAHAEVRGMTFVPWSGKWILAPRGIPFELDCNYLFWARKPLSLPNPP